MDGCHPSATLYRQRCSSPVELYNVHKNGGSAHDSPSVWPAACKPRAKLEDAQCPRHLRVHHAQQPAQGSALLSCLASNTALLGRLTSS
jgi:hypothetical protein